MVDTTTIRIKLKTKKRLDLVKLHPRETYDDIIKRLIKFNKGENKAERVSER
jgi:hypothetical protein